jgi:hypothetical protein
VERAAVPAALQEQAGAQQELPAQRAVPEAQEEVQAGRPVRVAAVLEEHPERQVAMVQQVPERVVARQTRAGPGEHQQLQG